MRALITGSTGLLGGWLVREATARFDEVVAIGGPSTGVNLADEASAEEHVAAARPDVVIHAAALSAIADCARDPNRARRANTEATRTIVRLADRAGARFVHVSTDLVFGGDEAPYREADAGAPTSIYGRTKLEAESIALAARDSVVARVALLFGPTLTKRRGFFDTQVAALRAGEPLRLFDDEWRSPLSLWAAAEALSAIARSTFRGLIHIGGPERLGRAEMGDRLAAHLGVSTGTITRTSRTSVPGEPRPKDVSLDRALFDRTFPGIARGSFEEECTRMMRLASTR